MNGRLNGRAGLAALAVVGGLVLSGCGGAATLTAAETAPEVRLALTKVDSALAAHHYVTARRELASLITQTRQAQEDGTLSAEAADRIIASARALFALVPKPVAATPTPTATPTPQVRHEPPKVEKKKHGKPGKGKH